MAIDIPVVHTNTQNHLGILVMLELIPSVIDTLYHSLASTQMHHTLASTTGCNTPIGCEKSRIALNPDWMAFTL